MVSRRAYPAFPEMGSRAVRATHPRSPTSPREGARVAPLRPGRSEPALGPGPLHPSSAERVFLALLSGSGLGSAVRSVLSSEVTAAEWGSGGPSKGQRMFLLEPPEKGQPRMQDPPAVYNKHLPLSGDTAHRAGEGRSSSSHGTGGATLGPRGVHSQARVQRVPRAEAAGAPRHGISRRTPAPGSLGPRRCLLGAPGGRLRADSPAAGLSRVRVCLSGMVPGRAEAAGLRPSSADDLGGLLDGRSGAPPRSPEAGAPGEGPADLGVTNPPTDPDALASLSIAWFRPWSRSGHFCLPRTGRHH